MSALVACAASACAGASAAPKPRETPPTATATTPANSSADAGAQSLAGTTDAGASELVESDDPDIRKMLRKLAVVRGLRAKKPVPGVELGRKELIAKIKDKVLREIPPEAIRREGDSMKLHGFLPPEMDYLDETMKLLEAQLAGFYEPKDGTMYIASDMDEMNSTATLAHELVHALQDQYYDLKSRSDYKPGESDKQTALACLAEGDATSVMTDVILKRVKMTALDQSDAEFDEQMRASMNVGPARKVPMAMRTSLVMPYIEGIKFVHALRRAGGFAAVDQAWRDPPTSTEQIMHPEKWRAHEPALVVATPTAATLGASGAAFSMDQDDVNGELGLRTAYEEWVPRADAAEVAKGWGGDHSAIFTRGDEIASMTHVRYDAGQPAAKDFATLAAGLADKLGKPAVSRADFVCFERKAVGPLAVRVSGDDLAFSAGPARRVQSTWASTSSCKIADAWTREALAK